ncbi:MAG: tetratricopeptide repeat protein, partial [Hyphomicrobiaceae bacterium]
EHDRVFQKHVINIDAYDAFLRARKAVDSPNRANIERGEELFKRVIELDPSFAGGYAGLAFNYSVKARFGYGSSRIDDVSKSLELAKKAIELDRNFAWSHIALASAFLAKGKTDLAVDAAREAIAIQPGGYEENLFMGFYLQFAGEAAQGVKHLELARDLSRIDTVRGLSFLAIAYFMKGDYRNSEAIWKKRIEKLGPVKSPIGSVFMSASQWYLDKRIEAAQTTERYKRLNPNFRMSNWTWLNTYKSEQDRKRLYDAAVKAGMPE